MGGGHNQIQKKKKIKSREGLDLIHFLKLIKCDKCVRAEVEIENGRGNGNGEVKVEPAIGHFSYDCRAKIDSKLYHLYP